VWVGLLGEKNARRFEDLVGPTQLGNFLAEPPVLFEGIRRGPVMAFTSIGLILTDPVSECFGMYTELIGEVPDHGLRVGLPVKLDRTLAKLVGVFAGGGHRNLLFRVYQTMIESLRANGGTSVRVGTRMGSPVRIEKLRIPTGA
jgi:hypothetical protein